MALNCPRCGRQVETLVPLDSVKYYYQGPLKRVCEACADSMMAAGDLVPSGTAERVVRAKRVAQQTRREIAEVRNKQWLIRIGITLLVAGAGVIAWMRFIR
jgi:hypothetical protein